MPVTKGVGRDQAAPNKKGKRLHQKPLFDPGAEWGEGGLVWSGCVRGCVQWVCTVGVCSGCVQWVCAVGV